MFDVRSGGHELYFLRSGTGERFFTRGHWDVRILLSGLEFHPKSDMQALPSPLLDLLNHSDYLHNLHLLLQPLSSRLLMCPGFSLQHRHLRRRPHPHLQALRLPLPNLLIKPDLPLLR